MNFPLWQPNVSSFCGIDAVAMRVVNFDGVGKTLISQTYKNICKYYKNLTFSSGLEFSNA